MTPVPPVPRDAAASAGDHPGDEVLALSLEGPAGSAGPSQAAAEDPAHALLGPAELATVEAHLAGCARCRTRRAGLAEVPSLLRAMAGSGPDAAGAAGAVGVTLPADVADRLEQALRAAEASVDRSHLDGEADARDHVGDVKDAEAVGAAPSRPLTTSPAAVLPLRRRRLRSTTVLSAAAGLAAVGLVGGLVWGAVSDGSPDYGGSTSSAAGASQPATGSGGGSSAGPVLVVTGLDLDDASLAGGVRSVLRRPPSAPTPIPLPGEGAVSSPASSPAAGKGPQDLLAPLLTPAGLRTCAQRLAPDQPLREVLTIRWKGSPAAVLVFPTPDDPGHTDAYAVTPDCPVGEFLGFVRIAT